MQSQHDSLHHRMSAQKTEKVKWDAKEERELFRFHSTLWVGKNLPPTHTASCRRRRRTVRPTHFKNCADGCCVPTTSRMRYATTATGRAVVVERYVVGWVWQHRIRKRQSADGCEATLAFMIMVHKLGIWANKGIDESRTSSSRIFVYLTHLFGRLRCRAFFV